MCGEVQARLQIINICGVVIGESVTWFLTSAAGRLSVVPISWIATHTHANGGREQLVQASVARLYRRDLHFAGRGGQLVELTLTVITRSRFLLPTVGKQKVGY